MKNPPDVRVWSGLPPGPDPIKNIVQNSATDLLKILAQTIRIVKTWSQCHKQFFV